MRDTGATEEARANRVKNGVSYRVADFDFHLPTELIAQHPPAERGDSRMMAVSRTTGEIADHHFRGLPTLLNAGDLLVMNDSRVIPARLFARRAGLRTQSNSPAPSGNIEVLLTQPLGNGQWRALVKPGRKVPAGERLIFGDNDLQADVVSAGEFGERTLQFSSSSDFFGTLERIGHIPLPPYIHREGDREDDRQRYQTVYAGTEAHGSAAAPTAGLHFTPAILQSIRARGVEIAHVTLHVGLGTFQPVRVEELADIRLHEEHYTLTAETAAALLRARRESRRIVAVGTTTTRTLEHVAATGQVHEHSGSTSIFLQPGHSFALVDALLTNFHLPQSTLLMLVSAFASSVADAEEGRQRALNAYAHAVNQRYRFFSYGDCMFLS